jgi:hypothetical protein
MYRPPTTSFLTYIGTMHRFTRAATVVTMALLLAASGAAGVASPAATAGTDGAQAFERAQANGLTAGANVTLTFPNQSTNGTAVTVESVLLPEGGFVQITDGTGATVGQTDYLDPGFYREIEVALDEPLAANRSLTAFAIRDANDNEQLDGTGPGNDTDAVYRTAAGDAVVDGAFVRLAEPAQPENVTDDNETNVTDDNETNATASLTFENQASNGTTVVVDRAVLPRGGFVVVHTATLLEGDDAESVRGVSEYLAPGTHSNVTVQFDQPITDTRRLVVVSYRDTNGDRTFEFYERNRSVDAPYFRDGNNVVADDAFVTVQAANATADGGNATAGGGNATA